ncbi:MAG: hypothetical protein VKI81_08715 [Synechococcaceae cyanobacterium]|nr:hypothetical protein [Synechococcaceae cyanobacterium]
MRAEPGSPLPAPWRNPWGLLLQDLRAVAASERLRLRALARRNREGELWRPAFWPDALAAAFWPLVLVGLASLVALALLLPRPAPPPQAPRAAPVAEPGPALAPARPEAPSLPAPTPGAAPEAMPEGAPQVAPGSAPAGDGETAAGIPEPDPLLLALEAGESDSLLQGVEAEPARAALRLELADGFARLPARQRQERAGRWQERARRLGYERLELHDAAGRSLGRTPLVGSGMILLDPVPLP